MALEEITFTVVEFEDGIQVIPNNWIQKDTSTCCYPDYKTDEHILRAIKKRQTPQEDWLSYRIKRFFGVYSKCIVVDIVRYIYLQGFL